ncbi:MAG: rRNA maturation RNase YbeY [cyanobacterium endosymbiont of Rhopalodia musculus]|uniref:rRNA maturation RNase YbeY n=1 Tax=cyanobacterium endosymbiont of Epithemia clementina EcSB TaxID=3034674 RepID=UPI002480963F|nr:rRNA maturation RNase YbeY [cyanobacterium endosymbiont of Epithemia clementina EcSB]WGT67373.1 rRNA maturation RNase YbeY [cyanobacterium endosymbiont of Epithemia clementina EcSB]
MTFSSSKTLTVDLYLQYALDFKASNDSDVSDIFTETWQQWIQIWLEELHSITAKSEAYELSLRLTSDYEIQTFNNQYRHKNQPTDVLAFAALEVKVPQSLEKISTDEPLYLGDIIISVDTARKQARQNHHSLTVELAWLVAHGLLHLLGWDHPDKESLGQMLAQQETLLKLVGLQRNN